MATAIPMGIVSLKAEGAYAADKLYKKGMWVTSSGSSYAYINPTPAAGVPLTDTSHWQQIASQGLKGDTGDVTPAAIAARDAAEGYRDDSAGYAAQLANYLSKRYGFDSYGYFVKPSDFLPALPCTIYVDSDGVLHNDYNFAQHVGGTSVFVDVETGADTTGNGSELTPYKTVKKALTVIASAADGAYTVYVKSDKPLLRGQGVDTVTLTNKQVAIIPNNSTGRIIMAMGELNPVWSEDGAGTWKSTRSSVYSVYDFRDQDENGVYIPYTVAATLSECQSTEKTWYTDNIYVWVHTPDGLTPTVDTITANMFANQYVVTLLGTSSLYLYRCDFVTGANKGIEFKGDNTGESFVGKLVCNQCTFTGGDFRSGIEVAANAFQASDVKEVYMFDCFGAYANGDIFSYAYQNADQGDVLEESLVLEFNVDGRDAGMGIALNNLNISTAHNGANILRFGTKGDNASVPIADVGGCYSICVKCSMANARHTIGTYFFGDALDDGKAVIIGCASDDNAIGLNALIPAYVYGFIGNVKATGNEHIIA